MTLTDFEENKMHTNDNVKMDISMSLSDVLVHAKDEERLVCGVYESGKMLERHPDEVMMCILPEVESEEVTLQIHFTLIKAFCWENDIHLLRVDSKDKLAKLLSCPSTYSVNDNTIPIRPSDCSCVLVGYPVTSTAADEDVFSFCKMMSDQVPQPIINL